MVECHKRSKKGERMQIDYIIAEHWQKELQKHFSPEASQADFLIVLTPTHFYLFLTQLPLLPYNSFSHIHSYLFYFL